MGRHNLAIFLRILYLEIDKIPIFTQKNRIMIFPLFKNEYFVAKSAAKFQEIWISILGMKYLVCRQCLQLSVPLIKTGWD